MESKTQRNERCQVAEKRENVISELIIQAGIEVYRLLGGPGLLESIYEDALFYELKFRGLHVLRQVSIPVIYKGTKIRDPFRLDLLIEN